MKVWFVKKRKPMIFTQPLPSGRWLLAAITILLGITGLAASVVSDSGGVVQGEGKLVIDGQVTPLSHAYALRREAPPPYKGGIVDLFITNQIISAETLAELLEDRYPGSQTMRGIWFTFAPSGDLKDSAFLLEAGAVSAYGKGTGIRMMDGGHTISEDRIKGKLEFRNEGVTSTTAYAVSFDAPLNRAPEKGAEAQRPGDAAGIGHGAIKLLAYTFQSVSANDKGAIIRRRPGQAKFYVENIAGIGLEMVHIAGASFSMGSSGVYEAQPAHQVTVPSFYIGKYEVTQAQWQAVAKLPRVLHHLDPNPSHFKGDHLPVESVSWDEAIEFCARLSKASGRSYRLPAEAEWEYACRAGTDTPYAFGEILTAQLANYDPKGAQPNPLHRARTTPGGAIKIANRFGLYDMHGNVAEWCMDPWHTFYVRAPTDGTVWEAGGDKGNRVYRGGSWDNLDRFCRSDYRDKAEESRHSKQIGFRVVAADADQVSPATPMSETKSAEGTGNRPGAGSKETKGPGGLPLIAYDFDTVRVDLHGAIENRRKGQARYYVENLKGTRIEMVMVPSGSFKMGRAEDDREKPVHQVMVPSFYMGKYEVTQAQWRAVAKLPRVRRSLVPDPSHFKGDNLPLDSVSWHEAIEFCARLSRATGRRYCLPTEAEWEYACRGGATSEFAFGDNITPDLVNYDGRFSLGSAPKGEFRKQTIPVGSLGVANGFGLYDMDGNVREWCLDRWHENYRGAPRDGRAWLARGTPDSRVTRGGSWDLPAHMCRAGDRNWCPSDSCRLNVFGFRIVLDGRSCAGSR